MYDYLSYAVLGQKQEMVKMLSKAQQSAVQMDKEEMQRHFKEFQKLVGQVEILKSLQQNMQQIANSVK